MKEFKVLLVLVLITAFAFGCKAKALPVIRETGLPTAEKEVAKESPEATPSEKAVSAIEEKSAISEEIQRLLDEGTLAREGEYYTVKVQPGTTWYYDWTDVFHTVTGENTCFSESSEAEGEAAFWTAVHQIPRDIHPDKFSGILKIPRSCKEAKMWAENVVGALKQGENDAWDGWAAKLAENLEKYPEYDYRKAGGK